MVFRPATPGFIVTLAATVLLAIVSFGVPVIKSVYFLRAQVSLDGVNDIATFGVLGFCLDSPSGTSCTSAKVGYEFDPNSLLDNTTPIQIPQVIVKWLTDALVLHIVAFVLAAISAVFGLLAHIREFATVYCSTFISGLAAAVALVAFIFDIAFFFLTKSRINAIKGSSAQIGNAVWLTLAAFILLFFAGCFYSIGRCCVVSRPRGPRVRELSNDIDAQRAEALRLDAVKAEADRKARQKQQEMGLPAFQEYDSRKPLTLDDDEPYYDNQLSPRNNNNFSSGYFTQRDTSMPNYVPAPQGRSALDAYYTSTANVAAAPTYPPPPQPPRQGSTQNFAGVDVQNANPGPYNQNHSGSSPDPSQFISPQRQYSNGGQEQYASVIHDRYPSASHNQYPSGISDPYATTGHNQQYSQHDRHPSYPTTNQYSSGSHDYGQYNSSGYSVPGVENSRRQSPSLQVDGVYTGQPRAPSSSPPSADYKLPPGIVVGQPSMGRDDYTFAPMGYASVAIPQNQGRSTQEPSSPHGPRSPSGPKAGF